MRFVISVLALVLTFSAGAQADARGTAQQAKALLDKAAAHYQSAGREKALGDFTNKSAGYIDQDLYVFCFSPEQKMTAHGANAALIGKDTTLFRDSKGNSLTGEMLNIVNKSGGGQIDYEWVHPGTKKLELKSSYFQKLGADICAVGFYK